MKWFGLGKSSSKKTSSEGKNEEKKTSENVNIEPGTFEFSEFF